MAEILPIDGDEGHLSPFGRVMEMLSEDTVEGWLEEGKVDALVFSGGIGENSWEVRRAICEKLSFLRIEIDNDVNREDKELTSKPHSPVKVLVLKTDEELEMVLRLLEHIL